MFPVSKGRTGLSGEAKERVGHVARSRRQRCRLPGAAKPDSSVARGPRGPGCEQSAAGATARPERCARGRVLRTRGADGGCARRRSHRGEQPAARPASEPVSERRVDRTVAFSPGGGLAAPAKPSGPPWMQARLPTLLTAWHVTSLSRTLAHP